MPDFTAGIFIINHKKEILLTHATHSPMKYWGIPKGLVDEAVHETHLDAAIREVEEETGIKILRKGAVHHLGNMKYKTGNKVLVAYYVFLEDLLADDLIIVGKDDLYVMNCDRNPDNVPGVIETIDTSLLWCRSMVTPRKDGETPFPEVDGYRWFPLDAAEKILYQPQKALLPDLYNKMI